MRKPIAHFILVLLAWVCSTPKPVDAQYTWEPTFATPTKAADLKMLSASIAKSTCAFLAHELILSPFSAQTIYLRSFDGGRTWSQFATNFNDAFSNSRAVGLCQLDSLHAWACGAQGLLYYTSDAGENWTKIDIPCTGNLYDVSFCDTNNGIVAGGDSLSLYVTSNGGRSWTNTPIARHYLWKVRCFAPGRFFAFAYGAGPCFWTHDNWTTVDSSSVVFDPANNGGDNRLFTACTPSEGDTLIAYGARNVNGQTLALLYRSTDHGRSWSEPFDARQYSAGLLYVTSIASDTLLAAGDMEHSRVLLSFDRGATWQWDSIGARVSTQPPQISMCGLRTEDGRLIVGLDDNPLQGSGWIGVGTLGSARVVAREYLTSTAQVFPNPSAVVVNIRTSPLLPYFLTDLLGRKVRSGVLNTAGEATVDVSELPEGCYWLFTGAGSSSSPSGKVFVSR